MKTRTLQELRKHLGISQTELAARTGLCQTSISLIEHGKHYPFQSTRQLIEYALQDQPIDWFRTYLDGVRNGTPKELIINTEQRKRKVY